MNFSRNTFDNHLQKMTDDTLLLASRVSEAVHNAIDALGRMDSIAAGQVIENDEEINARRYQIENDVIVLIATQQPVGRDVHFLAAILEIITELERIGDYAKGICKIQLLITREDCLRSVISDLKRMSVMGLSMLNDSLGAFINKDVAFARQIPDRDDAVDSLYNDIRSRLVSLMIKDMSYAQNVDYLIWVAHNLERLADRVSNICERIIYVYIGEMKELDGPRKYQPPEE